MDKTSAESTGEGLQFVTQRIADLVDMKLTGNTLTTIEGGEALNKELEYWRKELTKYATESQRQAETRRQAEEKVQAFEDAVERRVDQVVNNGTFEVGVDEKVVKEASDRVVERAISNPDNKDLTRTEKLDQQFSTSVGVQALAKKLEKYQGTTLQSGALKESIHSLFRGIQQDNIDADGNLNPSQAAWSEKAKESIKSLQVVMNNSQMRSTLSADEQAKANYLVHAVQSGISKNKALEIMNSPPKEGYTSPTAKEWRGLLPTLGLEKASDHLKQDANQMYNYILARRGHEAALAATRELVGFAHINNNNVDVLYGKHYGDIEYDEVDLQGKPVKGKISLEDLVKNLSKRTVSTHVHPVTGKVMAVNTSGANILAQSLIGNSVSKDQEQITSLQQIPGGVTGEVVGDNIVFISNVGQFTLTKKGLEGIAKELHRDRLRDERIRERKKFKDAIQYAGSGYLTEPVGRNPALNPIGANW